MSIGSKISAITMELYETDVSELLKFVQSETEEIFTEKYLILYDFAIDCRYSKCIQPDLFNVLLPYYLHTIEQAIVYGNRIAVDIYFQFNIALFFNRNVLKNTIGEDKFKEIMKLYIDLVIASMGIEGQDIMDWVPLFNTTIALDSDNLHEILNKILHGELKAKYAFFKYLSVIVLEEKDNLLVGNTKKEFWYSDIWLFDDGYFGRKLFWEDEAVENFDKLITVDMIGILFNEVKRKIYDELGVELYELLREEIKTSMEGELFFKRKIEYLDKIACNAAKQTYWSNTI